MVPRAMKHFSPTVPDIEAAILWYGEIFGFQLIMGPRTHEPHRQETSQTGEILGLKYKKGLQAHFVTANGVGLELFQFIDSPVEEPDDNLEYWKNGFWHIFFTDPNIEILAQKIEETGARLRSDISNFVPGTDRKLIYCEYPFGNVIELFSHSYEQTFSNWPLSRNRT